MRITYNLRESMRVLLSGEPCTLTFRDKDRLQRYEGTCHKGVAHFPLLDYSTTVPQDHWIARQRRAA